MGKRLDVDEYLIIDCYEIKLWYIFTDVFNDIWVKRYTTQKFKLQWGQNLSKFAGVMIGGVSLNGNEIMQQAEGEIMKLEQEVKQTMKSLDTRITACNKSLFSRWQRDIEERNFYC